MAQGDEARARGMLDTTRRVATPEGIELTLRLVGPVPRALAWAIDLALRAAVVIGVLMVAMYFGRAGWGIALLTMFIVEWLAPAWFEVLWNGQTPGKRALGIAVVHDDGTPVRWGPSLTRNLLRAVDFLPFLYGFGLAAMLANRDFKRLGDLAAGTVVVYAPRRSPARTLPEAPPHAAAVPAHARGAARGARPRRALRQPHAGAPRGARRAARAARRPRHRRGRRRAPHRHGQPPRGQAMKQAPFETAHRDEWQAFERYLDAPRARSRRSRRKTCRGATGACATTSRWRPTGSTART